MCKKSGTEFLFTDIGLLVEAERVGLVTTHVSTRVDIVVRHDIELNDI